MLGKTGSCWAKRDHAGQNGIMLDKRSTAGIRRQLALNWTEWPAKRELSTWVKQLRYPEEEKRTCDLMIARAVRRRLHGNSEGPPSSGIRCSQWYNRRMHPGPVRQTGHTMLRTLLFRIAANAACQKRHHWLRGSGRPLPCVSLGLRQRTNSRPAAAAGRWFRCCDSRWSDEYLSREWVLSAIQPVAAIA